jgi:hypothetical protein
MKRITLLLTLLCASALNGMDPTSLYELRRTGPENPQPELGTFGYLPSELLEKIIQDAIASNNTFEKTINTINAVSALRGVKYDNINDFMRLARMLANEYNNLEDFTKLVHIISDKFNMPTAEVAGEFLKYSAESSLKSTVGRYLDNGKLLMGIETRRCCQATINLTNNLMNKLIIIGADVNFSTVDDSEFKYLGPWKTPLQATIMRALQGTIESSNPDIINLLLKSGAKPRDKDLAVAQELLSRGFPELAEIIQIIKDAMNK